MWKLEFTKKARKDLLRQEKIVVTHIAKKINSTLKTPETKFEQLVDSEYWRLRVGNYRIIAFLDHEKKVVEIQRIGHRKSIYRNL